MRIELLVDAHEFWERLRDDAARARARVLLQTFSFEGDRVGARTARSLLACGARDRRLLVDAYSLLFQNDRLIPGPAFVDAAFRREWRATHRWVRRLRREGVGVRFGNPLGPSPMRLLRRSHKKLAVVDGHVAYLGGINFCDHNFAWHDVMLRVEDAALARHLARDFDASWRGRPVCSDRRFGRLRVVSLNGRRNAEGFRPVLEAIGGARAAIDVISPYLSPPFTDHLARAAAKGVRVRVLTPARNNKPNLARFVLEAARRNGFEVVRYAGRMNHTKALLVDGELLVVGSTNFDAMSYHVLEELFLLTDDPDVVRTFRRRVWEADTRRPGPAGVAPTVGTRLGHRAVRAGARLAAACARP